MEQKLSLIIPAHPSVMYEQLVAVINEGNNRNIAMNYFERTATFSSGESQGWSVRITSNNNGQINEATGESMDGWSLVTITLTAREELDPSLAENFTRDLMKSVAYSKQVRRHVTARPWRPDDGSSSFCALA